MPSYMEFEGKDIEQVKEKASKKLKISIENLKYDVVSYGSTGIFGLVGTKNAKIRVQVPETAVKLPEADPAEGETAGSPEEDLEKAPVAAVSTVPPDPEMIEIGKKLLERIVEKIADHSAVTVEQKSDRLLYNVQNDNPAILIGKRGQTLEALQYIVDKAVNRQNKNRIRVQVDVEGYLENRKKNLKELATRMAQKAKKTGKPATVGQMNAHDRRIVHLTLKNDSAVRTQSMGDGFYRKLLIFPKKKGSQKEKVQ